MNIKKTVKKLVSINEIGNSLNVLDMYLINTSLHKEVIMIKGRLANFNQKLIHNLADDNYLKVEKNQINHAILSILDRIEAVEDINHIEFNSEKDRDIVMGDKKVVNISHNKKVKVNL